MLTKKVSIILFSSLLSLFSLTTNAATVNAFTQVVLNGIPTEDSDLGPSSANVLIDNGEAKGQGASNNNGQLAASASFFGASGTNANVSTNVMWTETFQGTAGANAQFNFFIPQAAIGFEANNVGSLSGGFVIEILLNGNPEFLATANVDTISNSPQTAMDILLTQTGTTLNGTFATDVAPGFGLGGAGYRFSSFSGSLDLILIEGENQLSYSMRTFVNGLIGETSALASIGDPLDLSQNQGVTLITQNSPSNVPVPAAIWLFGTAGLGLLTFCKRSKTG